MTSLYPGCTQIWFERDCTNKNLHSLHVDMGVANWLFVHLISGSAHYYFVFQSLYSHLQTLGVHHRLQAEYKMKYISNWTVFS